jgi:ankyrin repeat protein
MSDFSQNAWQQAKRGNWDPLQNALASGNAELDVDFVYGPLQESFLHLAATGKDNSAGLAKALIDKGCNLNSANAQGVTALYIACAFNATELVELLMKSGANPNTLIPAGREGAGNASKEWQEACRTAPAPLHVAALRGYSDVIETMLGFGELDAGATNASGDTALHLACTKGHLGAARLLAKRIHPTATRNAAGETPLDLAEDEELKEALSSAGATSGTGAMSASGGVTAGTPQASHKQEDPAAVLERCSAEVPEIFGREMALQLCVAVAAGRCRRRRRCRVAIVIVVV